MEKHDVEAGDRSELARATETLAAAMRGRRVLAITGAGISTDAGIPDYRGPGRKQEPSVTYQEFEADLVWQRWVWQRNEESWRSVAALKPTEGHRALARLEAAGKLLGVATQNVDNLHAKAGSRNIAELHGNFMRVACTDCRGIFPRDGQIDELIRGANPAIKPDPNPANAAVLAAADRESAEKSSFSVPPCPSCGGLLKPDITFFGESLPDAALDAAFAMARRAEAVLVAGSSLFVQTAVWVLREGLAHGAKLMVVNRGQTAADDIADLRIEGGCSQVLAGVADTLLGEKR